MKSKYNFCTISTASHLHKSLALAESLKAYGGFLHILFIDEFDNKTVCELDHLKCYSLEDLSSETSKDIISKYRNSSDKLRWSLKGVFLQKVLSTQEKVIYLDNDIYFFNDFKFLFEELNTYDILLTPHHYPSNPGKNQNWFEANFRVGLYNAGFLAANKNATETLEWWAKSCLYRCEKNHFRGLFDDQKYLDLVPILHPNTKVLEHKGCNVAGWNKVKCKLSTLDNKPIINDKYPLIFYHFNNYSLGLLNEEDYVLKTYFQVLRKYKPEISIHDFQRKDKLINRLKLLVWDILNYFNAKN